MREKYCTCAAQVHGTEQTRPDQTIRTEDTGLFIDSTSSAQTLGHISYVLPYTLPTVLQGAGEG